MRNVLITGANKGLGYELARHLMREGNYVYLGCRNIEQGKKALSDLQKEGLHNGELLEIDISNQESVRSAAELFDNNGNKLDILINNAGILGKRQNQDEPLNIDDVREVFETNFFGTVMITEAFLPYLRESSLPVTANVTSDLASLTSHKDPDWILYKAKSISYGPSKTALNAYTVALAYEYKDLNFKINCVTPGGRLQNLMVQWWQDTCRKLSDTGSLRYA
ncbi:SDR family NAD(P)-dependent oxidoreductase [Flavobacterium sp. ST-75]|uniref:SDR family NAD(P)-dependent oxidoreductase n=1 Tax=Flavobacterium rhizophilum TaxID=3163296 RepID=A0ABW8Y9V5_9FLAO